MTNSTSHDPGDGRAIVAFCAATARPSAPVIIAMVDRPGVPPAPEGHARRVPDERSDTPSGAESQRHRAARRARRGWRSRPRPHMNRAKKKATSSASCLRGSSETRRPSALRDGLEGAGPLLRLVEAQGREDDPQDGGGGEGCLRERRSPRPGRAELRQGPPAPEPKAPIATRSARGRARRRRLRRRPVQAQHQGEDRGERAVRRAAASIAPSARRVGAVAQGGRRWARERRARERWATERLGESAGSIVHEWVHPHAAGHHRAAGDDERHRLVGRPVEIDEGGASWVRSST